MGNNPRSNALQGMENLFSSQRTILHADPSKATDWRWPAETIDVVDGVGIPFKERVGAPGLAVEVIPDTDPPVWSGDYFPNTETGKTATGWTRSTGANDYDVVNDFGGADYMAMSTALRLGVTRDLKFRGNETGLSSSFRVVKVQVHAYCLMTNPDGPLGGAGQSTRAFVQGILDRAGNAYLGDGGGYVAANSRSQWIQAGEWHLDPATDAPWTVANFNRFLDATNDEFGIRISQAGIVANGFRVYALLLRAYVCVDERLGSYYDPSWAGQPGWNKITLTDTKAPVLGKRYRTRVYALAGQPGSSFTLGAVRDPWIYDPPTAADVGDHRCTYDVALSGPGGVVPAPSSYPGIAGRATRTPGEQIGCILYNGSTVLGPSNPYCELKALEFVERIAGVRLSGAGYVTTPDVTALAIGSAGFAVGGRWALDDWTPGAIQTLWSQWHTTSNKRGAMLQLLTNGKLRLSWSSDGTALNTSTVDTTSAVGFADGSAKYVVAGLTKSGATLAAFFLVSDDGLTWTVAGGGPATTPTSVVVFDSDAAFMVGAHSGGATEPLSGVVGYVTVAKAFTDTLLFTTTGTTARLDQLPGSVTNVAFTRDDIYPATLTTRAKDTTVTDLQARTWTLNGDAAFTAGANGAEITTASGTNPYEQIVVAAGGVTGVPDGALVFEVHDSSDPAAYSTAGNVAALGYLDAPAQNDPYGVPVFPRGAQLRETWTPTASHKYVVIVRSLASPTRPWYIYAADTRSDLIPAGSGVTLANVQAASHQGTTDRAVRGGVPDPRYDLGLVLVKAPTAPALSVTGAGLTARYNLLEWANPGLGETWAGIDIWRSLDVSGAESVLIASYRPVPGQTRTQTGEAHRSFEDHEAPLSTDQRTVEVAYSVVVAKTDGTYSMLTYDAAEPLIAPHHGSLIVCNAAPYLNQYLEVIPQVTASREARVMSRRFIGRKHPASRVRADEEPTETWEGTPGFFDHLGADSIRVLRQASRENRRMCWQHPLGDQLFGALDLGNGTHTPGRNYENDLSMVRTADGGETAGYNRPATINLDGTDDAITIADADALDPGPDDFTFVLAAELEDAAVTHASKRNASDGWAIAGDGAGGITAVVDGAATVNLTGGEIEDGLQVVTLSRDVGTARLRVAATIVDTDATFTASIANANKVTIGANNSGASAFAQDKVTGFAYWARTLTPQEHQNISDYFAGDFTAPRPPGAVFFFDRRDARCGVGTRAMSSLAGPHLAEIVGDPSFAGTPWPIATLEAG